MRFQALKPQIFTLSPSDMKLLNQVSTNTNFYAFVKVDGDFIIISHSVCETESLQILLYVLGQ